MKQSLKYGLLLLLTLLIHCATSQTMGKNSEVLSQAYSQKECSLVHKAISIHHSVLQRLYIFYSNQSCDLGHADIAQVPAEKSIQLLISYFREHKDSPCAAYDDQHHVPKPLSDPIAHYIYGFRKILI